MGGFGGGMGGGRGKSKQEKKADKNRPFVDISNIPDDPASGNPEVAAWRLEQEIKVAGTVPDPFMRYDQCPVPPALKVSFANAGYTKPSVIQAQAWPPAMARRDIIGVAKTGSGKTLGFLVPIFTFIQNRTWGHIDVRAGPVALVLAPVRELANQIQEECRKFGSNLGIHSTCVYGGSPKG